MNKDEEYVRSVWKDVDHSAGIYRPNGSTLFAPCQGFEAAAAFTRERLEQVRQLRREMELLGSFEHEAEDNSERALITSVIARLQSIYATLTQGMRPDVQP